MESKRRLSLEEQLLPRRQRDFNEIWEEQPRLTPCQHHVGVLPEPTSQDRETQI